MTPLKWFLVAASGLALVVVGVQTNALSKLRDENQALRAGSDESSKAGGDAINAEALRQQDDELARLREETKALARARNDIRQLRGQKMELDKLRAANQQLLAAQQAGTNAPGTAYITAAALTDAGAATPEAVCQTFFFAIRNGDVNRVIACFASGSKDAEGLARQSANDLENMRRELREQFGKFPGFRIATKTARSEDEVEIGIQSAPGGQVMKMSLRRFGSEWKLLQLQ